MAASNEPNNPVYELTLAEMLAKFGRNDEAIKLFEDMLKRYGDNDEVVTLCAVQTCRSST